MLNTPELLQLLHIIKSNNRIRVAKALTVVLVVWMLGASMYFLVRDIMSFLNVVKPELSMGWVDPRDGLGWVGLGWVEFF